MVICFCLSWPPKKGKTPVHALISLLSTEAHPYVCWVFCLKSFRTFKQQQKQNKKLNKKITKTQTNKQRTQANIRTTPMSNKQTNNNRTKTPSFNFVIPQDLVWKVNLFSIKVSLPCKRWENDFLITGILKSPVGKAVYFSCSAAVVLWQYLESLFANHLHNRWESLTEKLP